MWRLHTGAKGPMIKVKGNSAGWRRRTHTQDPILGHEASRMYTMSMEKEPASDAEILSQIRQLAAGISDERTRKIIQARADRA
jgi:hypothetical protein